MGWVNPVIFHCLSTSNHQTRTTLISDQLFFSWWAVSSFPGHKEAFYCFSSDFEYYVQIAISLSFLQNNKTGQDNPTVLNEIQYTVGDMLRHQKML